MILKHLLTGRQLCNFMLLQENDNSSGHLLIRNLIANNLTQGNSVHVLNYENTNSSSYEEFLHFKNFECHDCYFNPWNLNTGKSGSGDISTITTYGNGDVDIVIIDSLTYALSLQSLESVHQMVLKLKSRSSGHRRTQIVGSLNVDLINEDSIEFNEINRLADAIVVLSKQLESTVLRVTHRNSVGKFKDGVFEMKSVKGRDIEISDWAKTIQKAPEPTPQFASTFKLTLGDKEKESRSQVVLPYLKTTESKIIYEPDENDDWDDEDPDDDLEI